MLYSRGSDFPHNGGYLLLISFVPQKSHWIYLALCTVVIMWASQSFGAAEHTPPSLLSPISHPSSSSSSLFLSYLLPQHFLQYFFPVCRGGNSSSLNLSRGNLTARLQRLIGSNQDYWLPLCQNTFIHSHCWLLPSLARQQTPNDTLAEARRRSWGQRGRHSAAGGMVRAVCFSLMWAAVNDLGSSDETANMDGSKNIFFPCSNISLYLDQWW